MTIDPDHLERLLAEGTARPWHVQHGSSSIGPHINGIVAAATDEHGSYTKQIVETDAGAYGPDLPDADLIVSAVNSLPELIAVYRAALAWRDADAEHESAECTCGDRLNTVETCPATMAVDKFELGRGRLIAAIDRARGVKL